jgi:hypothetical protein
VIVTEAAEIDGQRGHRGGLPTAASDDAPELLDPSRRLHIAAGQAPEDIKLGSIQRLAHGRQQHRTPCKPTRAGEHVAKQARIGKRAA